MLATAAVYFVIAFFGENYEPGSHEARAATETGQENVEEPPQHESTETGHLTTGISGEHPPSNESGAVVSSSIQEKEVLGINRDNTLGPQKHEQIQKEATENHNIGENNIGTASESSNEITKRSIELPVFLAAGIAYTLVGLWMIIDNKRSRIPYVISTAGSLTLIGLYAVSHTIGFPMIGLEHVGVFDLLIAALQVAIVGLSAYVILSSLSTRKITTSAKRNV